MGILDLFKSNNQPRHNDDAGFSSYLAHRQDALRKAKSITSDYIQSTQVGQISEGELARLYSLSSAVFTCVQFRAENIAQVKFKALDGDDELHEWHGANRIVSNISDWLMEVETALCLYGDALSMLEFNRYNIPLSMAFINNQLWSVTTRFDAPIYNISPSNYNYDFNTPKRELTPQEVVFLRNAIDPFSDYRGQSPLETAYLSGATNVEMTTTWLYTFINRAIPAYMLQLAVDQPGRKPVDPESAVKGIMGAFRRVLGGGSKNTGQTFATAERWEVERLQADFDELASKDLDEGTTKQVLTAFQVYESLIIAGSSNYATARQEAMNWADAWLLPRTKRIGEAIAKQIKDYFPDVDNLRIVPDETTIPFLQDKLAIQQETEQKLVKTAAVSLGEYQKRLGLEPVAKFENLYWYEGIGWLKPEYFENAWTYQFTVAPTTLNTGILPGDQLIHDPGVSEQDVREDFAEAARLQAQARLEEAQAEVEVAGAEAEQVEAETDVIVDADNVPPVKTLIALTDDDIQTQRHELKQWRKAIQSKGKSYDFEFIALSATVEAYVKARLDNEPDTAYGDIFAKARELLGVGKAIQATRLDFENDFEDLLASARDGRISRRRFSIALRNLIGVSGRKAFSDGLVDGGVISGEPDDDDTAMINRMIAEQSGFVTSFGARLYGDGITDDEARNKPMQWYNKSISPFYDAGRRSADRNGMYEWVLGATEEHCRTCLNANGQIHRMQNWARNGILPQSSELECGGFNCDCRLVKTSQRARGRLSRIKAHDHA